MERGSTLIKLSFFLCLAFALFGVGCGHTHEFGYREKNAYLNLTQLFYYEHGFLPKTEKDLEPYYVFLDPIYRPHAGDRITIGTRPLTQDEKRFSTIWNSSGCRTLVIIMVIENQREGVRIQWGGMKDCYQKGHFWGILILENDSKIVMTYFDDPMNWACYASWTVAELLKTKDSGMQKLLQNYRLVPFTVIDSLYRKLNNVGPPAVPFNSKSAAGTLVRFAKISGENTIEVDEPATKTAFFFDLAKGRDQVIKTSSLKSLK